MEDNKIFSFKTKDWSIFNDKKLEKEQQAFIDNKGFINLRNDDSYASICVPWNKASNKLFIQFEMESEFDNNYIPVTISFLDKEMNYLNFIEYSSGKNFNIGKNIIQISIESNGEAEFQDFLENSYYLEIVFMFNEYEGSKPFKFKNLIVTTNGFINENIPNDKGNHLLYGIYRLPCIYKDIQGLPTHIKWWLYNANIF